MEWVTMVFSIGGMIGAYYLGRITEREEWNKMIKYGAIPPPPRRRKLDK